MNIKPVILPSKVNSEGKTNIKIRVIHDRKSREIATDHYILPSQWDASNNRVNPKKHPNANLINTELKQLVILYEQKLIAQPINGWTIERVLEHLKRKDESVTDFYSFFTKFIARKSTENKRTAQIYADTLSRIKTFIPYSSPSFNDITLSVLRDMEGKMRTDGLKTNSISMHLKNIRSVFNAAIDEEVVGLEAYPFRRLKIKTEKGQSKALTAHQIKLIRDMGGLTGLKALARDMFMLSFYLIGINNGDLYQVKKIDEDGRIRYNRAKTHRQYSIKVEPEAMTLIDRNKGETNLVSLADRYKETRGVNLQLNKALKTIGPSIKVEALTMYHARHTWATLAAGLDIPKETIAAALGHGGNSVTDTYISFDWKKIDEANRAVLNAIL